MNILTITTDTEPPVALVTIRIAEVDPNAATIAILNALAAIPAPRKPRSDKGAKRKEPQP